MLICWGLPTLTVWLPSEENQMMESRVKPSAQSHKNTLGSVPSNEGKQSVMKCNEAMDINSKTPLESVHRCWEGGLQFFRCASISRTYSGRSLGQ